MDYFDKIQGIVVCTIKLQERRDIFGVLLHTLKLMGWWSIGDVGCVVSESDASCNSMLD